MVQLNFAHGLLAGILLIKLAGFLSRPSKTAPCIDLYMGPASPVAYNVGELHQDNYGREGLAHVTVAGAHHHGLRGVEVWLQTFAPGTGTPIHRHACEEVFVIQRGGGTARFRGPGGGMRAVEFKQNDTLFIRPNLVHQIVNTGQEDVQALVVFDSPPIRIFTYPNWSVADAAAHPQQPYFWDRSCPPRLPPQLQQLANRRQQQQQQWGSADGGGTSQGPAAAEL